jgi:hypothetical protein
VSHRIKARLTVNSMGSNNPWPAVADLNGLIEAFRSRGDEVLACRMSLVGKTGETTSINNPDGFNHHDELTARLELLAGLGPGRRDRRDDDDLWRTDDL